LALDVVEPLRDVAVAADFGPYLLGGFGDVDLHLDRRVFGGRERAGRAGDGGDSEPSMAKAIHLVLLRWAAPAFGAGFAPIVLGNAGVCNGAASARQRFTPARSAPQS